MTRKELNLAIFEGKADKVLWQPRLHEWIGRHRENGTMPERFKDMDDLEIYDELRCSVRYAAHAGIETITDVERKEERRDNHLFSTIRTPKGEITTVHQEIWENGKLVNSRIVEYPVKTIYDLKVLTDVIEHTHYQVNQDAFRVAAERVGHRAEPTVFLNSSGFTELIKWWCGLEETFYLLHDHRKDVEVFLEASDRLDDRQVDAALQLPCRIFNFGDHATDEFTPPPILKRYMLPRWQRISSRLHRAGRFVHSHWDGHSHTILPYLKESGLDSVEALTPEPQGNITLEEIKGAVGDSIVVLDIIPAIHFLPQYTTTEVLEFTKKAIDMFAPRLILGVSDEISSTGQIEKIEAVSQLVDKVCGLAE